jgi:predicted aldo/keto reductase-like oxidoreductase
MQYTTLGKTGLKVSRLGFGAMRLPMEEGDERIDRSKAIPMIHAAFEAGMNYIDTAVGYCKQDSQRVVGEALKGWRDKIVVSTKNHYYDEDEKQWWQNLEESLERLDIDCIDIYNTHGVNAKNLEEKVLPRVLKWLTSAKDQGMIKHICTSFHDDCAGLMKVVDSGIYSSVTVQYNMLDRQLEDGIAHAHESGMGVVVMGPVAGGRLGQQNEVFGSMVASVDRIPELALRFVLCNENVDVALSGMSTMEQVEENIKVCSDDMTLNTEDQKIINDQLERLKKAADLYCTGCKYCLPCPNKVDIPRAFNIYNQGRVYGMDKQARGNYANWTKNQENASIASACVECGECEPKCPQNIPIIKQLQQAHAYLTDG